MSERKKNREGSEKGREIDKLEKERATCRRRKEERDMRKKERQI
jgi:hypothetical protein